MDKACRRNPPEENFIGPGNGYFPEEPVKLWTVVGSGVVITLYDNIRKVGGMVYYARPKPTPGQASTPFFAAPAIFWLLNSLISTGSNIEDLEAQIFGGANNPEHPRFQPEIHEQNVKTGLEVLLKKGIYLGARDVGGRHGRKVVFNTETGESFVAHVRQIRDHDWYPRLIVA